MEELCRGVYRANQVNGHVIIIAFGKHIVTNYLVYFQEIPTILFPPELQLFHKPNNGNTVQIETEFVAWTSFRSKERIDSVLVHDEDGQHIVLVEQTTDYFKLCEPNNVHKGDNL